MEVLFSWRVLLSYTESGVRLEAPTGRMVIKTDLRRLGKSRRELGRP